MKNIGVGSLKSALGRVIISALCGFAFSAIANDIYVAPPASAFDDLESGAGTTESPYLSLKWAVSQASEGDTVRLSVGEHELTEELTISKGITITGSGADNTSSVIVGDKRDHRLLVLNHTDVLIANLTVDGKGAKETVATGAGIRIETSGGTISNVVVRNCFCSRYATSGGGISIAQNSPAIVDSVVVSNCTTHCEGAGGGTALYMAGGIVRNSLFVKTRTPANANPGGGGTVYVAGGEMVNCTIAENEFGLCPGVRATGGLVHDSIIAGNRHTVSLEPKDSCWMGTASCFSNCVASAYINEFCFVEETPFADITNHDYTPSACSAAYKPSSRDLGAIERDATVFSADFRGNTASGFSPLTVTYTVGIVGASASNVVCYWDWDGDGNADETVDGVLSASHTFSNTSADVGLVVSNKVTGATVRAPMDQPVTAVSKTMYVVSGNTGAAAPYGSWATAAKTIADALSLAIDGSEIVLSNGTHAVSAEITLGDAVTIRGFDEDPSRTIVKSNGGNYRIFRMENAGAVVHHLTVQGSRANQAGAGINIGAGGTVSNLIVRDCVSNGYHGNGYGAGIYINSGSAALVDSVVISNCQANLEGAANAALYMAAGTVRNSLFTLNGNPANGNGVRNQLVEVAGGELRNCTIALNNSYDNPGVKASGSGRVIDCIIAENKNTSDSINADKRTWKGTASCFVNCVASAFINNTCTVEEHPFADAAHGDLTPSSGSAAVDGSSLQTWMTDALDIYGNPRVSGLLPDIGAVEMDKSKFSADFTADVQEGFSPLTVNYAVSINGAEAADVVCYWDWNGDGVADETVDGVLTASHTFSGCLDDVRLVVSNKVTGAVFNVASVRTVKATQRTIYVRAENANAAVPYDNWDCAAATISDALTMVIPGCELVLSNGTHMISDTIKIESPLTIRGIADDPADVIVKPSKTKIRAFHLVHPQAILTHLTVSDFSYETSHGVGVFIDAAGGVVSNVVVRNCTCAGCYQSGGGIYIASGANSALVDSVVITNCVSDREGDSCPALAMNAGTVRNSLFILNGNRANGSGCRNYTVGVYGGELVNSTIALNGSFGNPGVNCTGSGRVRNCIIAENVNTTDSQDAKNRTWAGTAANYSNCVATVKINDNCFMSEHPFVGVDDLDFTPTQGSGAADAVDPPEAWMENAKDIYGNPRISGDAADIGAIEREADQFSADFSADGDVVKGFAPFNASFTIAVSGVSPEFVEGTWNWGDGSAEEVILGLQAEHQFAAGEYNVTLTVRNRDKNVSFTVPVPIKIQSIGRTIYVNEGDQTPVYPYASWETAATNLADAVDAALDGCEIVIDNGVCSVRDEVAVYKNVDIHGRGRSGTILRSIGNHKVLRLENADMRLRDLAIENAANPSAEGGAVYIHAGGQVSNVVIRGSTGRNGVGVYIESNSAALVDACIISNCQTWAQYGGGGAAIYMKSGEVRNTLCVFNNAPDGDSIYGTVRILGGKLVNCTVVSNSAYNCAGIVPESTSACIVNTLIADNVSRSGNIFYPVWARNLDYENCFTNCAAPFAINKSCIAGENFFKNVAIGDFRLRQGSPAIDKGVREPWMTGARDLGGNPRISNGKVDIGCFEYPPKGFSLIFR